MKSALFVDFDNVYSGLRQIDPASADRFAKKPMEWMNWVVHSLDLPDHAPADARRRILVRRCYLNPQAYQRFRPSFNLAGFEIIDCPALTSEGKTSTDIHMVLDIVDLLQHETRYDEFIVFSADADFTPVLRRLRRFDRRTTVLAIGFPSAAYRASADLLIDQDDFVRNALGYQEEDYPAPVTVPPQSSLNDLSAAVQKLIVVKVAEAPAPIPLARLAPYVLSQVEGLDPNTWAGFGNFRRLVDSLSLGNLVVTRDSGGFIYDPERHIPPANPALPIAITPRNDGDYQWVADLIRAEVARSNYPVSCARLASLVLNQHPSLAADWNGRGVFRRFVELLDVSPVRFDWTGSGGRAYDPERHTLLPEQATDFAGQWDKYKDLLPVARQVHEATGVPLLPPDKFKTLFDAIAADLAEFPQFDFIEASKRVRDRCRDAGQSISRADVNFVLRGLLLRGHRFGEDKDDAATLSRTLADNVRSLCLREQIVLDANTNQAILRWITG